MIRCSIAGVDLSRIERHCRQAAGRGRPARPGPRTALGSNAVSGDWLRTTC
jgi:hypothetical protein